MGEIKRGKKVAESEDRSISFGVNEVSGFSTEPYQVRFRSLSPWFSRANAKVVLEGKIVAQDDYRTQTLNYNTPFTIGEQDRLHLQVTKRTIPFKTIFWLFVGGSIAMLIVFKNRNSLMWNCLVFGVAFLTCSRLLFAQAAMVNSPYSFESSNTAAFAIVFVPLVLALLAILLPFFMPGRIEGYLRQWETGAAFRWLMVAALVVFLFRLGFLAIGFKESINLGIGRFALSIIAVPAHIILFSLGCARLFAERNRQGAYDLSLLGRFFTFAVGLFLFQFATAFLVSDVGLFLFMIPQVLVVSLIGCAIFAETLAKIRDVTEDKIEIVSRSVMSLLLILPLVGMIWTFSSPRSLYSIPVLSNILATDDEIATGSTELRVLQFVNEDYLIKLGTDTAERIAQDHAIMENYARRGLWGKGYLQVNVIHAKRNTALNDNVSAIFIFAQFGIFGALAVMLAYVSVLAASSRVAKSLSGPVGWACLTAGLTFSLTSIYMMAANFGLLPFTGRNMYLLGLNSKSDIIESLVLLFFVIFGLVCLDHQQKSATAP
ncbi:MAG: hypothetical protein AAF357_19210, partial [Verrucomicrobiota bacterium]